MRTASKLVYSKENYYTENGEEYKIKTTVSLGDDCHNNICEWSITADIRWKNEYGIYKEYMCGCCHDEIIRHCPELAKFIPMHVCNHYGAPMYPVENGIYHTKNSDKSVVIEYLRISDKEYSKLSEAVDDKMYFKYLLFNLGIVDRWKRESDELIAELENLCGKKWVNPYKPEKERFTLTLTDEERSLIEERIEAGYYSTENIEKRREEAHKAKMVSCVGGKDKVIISPILAWTDKDVWEFLNKMNIKHCDLYDKGMKRIGCILCPMSSIGEMMKYPFDYPHWTKKFLNEIEILVKNSHYQELGENPNMVLAWYLSKRTVDDFKGLVRRVQSGKFRPNKKNKELWDKFIDYFDLKNVSIWER